MTRKGDAKETRRPPLRRPRFWISAEASVAIDEAATEAAIATAALGVPGFDMRPFLDPDVGDIARARADNWIVRLAFRSVLATRPNRDVQIAKWIDSRITEWAMLLVDARQARAADLALAASRDRWEAAGLDPFATVRLPSPVADRQLGDDKRVIKATVRELRHRERAQRPMPQAAMFPVSNAATRVRRALRENGYDPRGVLKPAEWQWLEEAQEYLDDEQLACAWERAGDDGMAQTRRDREPDAASRKALAAIRSMRVRAAQGKYDRMTDPAPHE